MTTGGGQRVGLVAAAGAPLAWLVRTLGEPGLRRPFLAGLVLSTLAMVVVFGGTVWGAFALVDAVVGADGGWGWGLLAAALKIVGVALAILASPVLFTVLVGIIGGGFLGTAHERARTLVGGAPYAERSVGSEAALALRGVGWSLRRLGRFLLWTLVLLAVGAIPVVGVVAIVLEAFLVAHALTWELFTPHFEAKGLGYADQRRFLRRRPALVLGLGGVGALLLLVPLAQPLVLFANQAAAGALSARIDPAAAGSEVS